MKFIITIKLIVVFLFFGNFAYADYMSGLSLDSAPSSLKRKFFKKTGKQWEESSFELRKDFFENWIQAKKNTSTEYRELIDISDSEGTSAKKTSQNSGNSSNFKVPKMYSKRYGKNLEYAPFDVVYSYEKNSGEKWKDVKLQKKFQYVLKYESNQQKISVSRQREMQNEINAERKKMNAVANRERRENIKRQKEYFEKQKEILEDQREQINFENSVLKQKIKVQKMRQKAEADTD